MTSVDELVSLSSIYNTIWLFFLHINICLNSFYILGQWIPATVGTKLQFFF